MLRNQLGGNSLQSIWGLLHFKLEFKCPQFLAVIELNIAQYCNEIRVRLQQCKDFETYRQFFLDFVDHVVYYKNLVELRGYVPAKSGERNDDGEIETTKIEYKITTEIEWAERMAQYWKKEKGSRISVMDFNSMVGSSKRRMNDVPLFSNEKSRSQLL